METIEKIKEFFKSLRKYPTETCFKYYPRSALKMGVCAGLAYRLRIPAAIPRLVFFFLWFVGPIIFGPIILAIVAVTYIVLMFAVPEDEAPADYSQVCDFRLPGNLYRFKGDAQMMGGICAAIAYKTRAPVLAIRFAMLIGIIFFMPLFYLYILAWVLLCSVEAPDDFYEICKARRPEYPQTHQTGERSTEETPQTEETPEVEETPPTVDAEFEDVETPTVEEKVEVEKPSPPKKRTTRKGQTRKKTTTRKKK